MKINSNIPFKFGVDSDGNYGYIKDGADTVTPFKGGANFIATIPIVLTATEAYGTPHTVTKTATLHITVKNGDITSFTIDNNSVSTSEIDVNTSITIQPNDNYRCASDKRIVISMDVSTFGNYGSAKTITESVIMQFDISEKTIPTWKTTNNYWTTSDANRSSIAYNGDGTIS